MLFFFCHLGRTFLIPLTQGMGHFSSNRLLVGVSCDTILSVQDLMSKQLLNIVHFTKKCVRLEVISY